MGFFTRKKVVENTPDAAYPAPYGDPGGHFDFPYEVTTTDAVSVTPVNADGVPTPYDWRGVMPPAVMEQEGADWLGTYRLEFRADPLIQPTFTELNPAPGSVDLEQPRQTPMFPAGTNRLIHSKGPVTGVYVERYDGDRVEIGRAPVGQNGPVTGGPDYAQQLALTFQAAQAVAYSQQAAASALVSAV